MTEMNPDGSHPREKEMYDYISNWCDTPFPFSKNESWARFGILGIISHLTLLNLPNTHIIEIGTGESSIYLTETARRLDRRIFYCDYAYGKIANPMTVNGYLHQDTIIIEEDGMKDANTHNNKAIAYCGLSDNFFRNNFPAIGFVFIDGDHNYEQVKKDFNNSFDLLVADGVICLHDTYPYCEEYTSEHRCGDVYKLRQELEKRDDLDCFTFTHGVGMDVGITMIRKKPKDRPYYNE
jgi:predicted O-methyltransferase YrrM